jgi:hypothetical protein
MMPLVSAMLLSLAAGLSLAEEHSRPTTASPGRPVAAANAVNAQGPSSPNDPSSPKAGIKPRPQGNGSPSPHRAAGTLVKERGTDQAGTGDGGQTRAVGVGSRALMGNEAPDASDQPETATGVDLKGMPVRFPAADTPE